MKSDLPAALGDQKEAQNPSSKVIELERQLWASIQSKGILHSDVQALYQKTCTAYEKIILNDRKDAEIQILEHSLWKLHYKHIDEFRKKIRQLSSNSQSTSSGCPQDVASNGIYNHMEAFMVFLSEAIEFYKDLIANFRKSCGITDVLYVNKNSEGSSLETITLSSCQYAVHRFLVCLGDLCRYRELCKKSNKGNQKWAIASKFYFEATMMWPDSGNPHNQLALLATYIGDDFLALYHCVRSLAVKEPFPDAWDNLMLLFEKNDSSQLQSLSRKVHFDFSKPWARCSSGIKIQSSSHSLSSSDLETAEHCSCGKTDLWPLFIRVISFFFLKSSLADFHFIFASTLSELEALLAMDDTELKTSLEPYEHLDSTRKGPYRSLQLVSMFIFLIHHLCGSPEQNVLKQKNDAEVSALARMAWTSIFICIGRFIERCLAGNNHPEDCILLPSVLLFVEWLAGNLDNAVKNGGDEKFAAARSYFFGAFVDLLNRLGIREGEVKPVCHTALWEDFELRGFQLIGDAQEFLNFATAKSSEHKNDKLTRAYRIFISAVKIAVTSCGLEKQMFYDELKGKFFIDRSEKASEMRSGFVEESSSGRSDKKDDRGVFSEEEEVIVFKPLKRYNSEPICTVTTDQVSVAQGMKPSDESLRRTASMFSEESEVQSNPLIPSLDTSNFEFEREKRVTSLAKEKKDSEVLYLSGPPSLNAWVVDRENTGFERGTKTFTKSKLPAIIEDVPSTSFTTNGSSSYVAPIPSAPLLPEDAAWYKLNPPSFKEGPGILGASPVTGFSAFAPMSSSEWLYHYSNNRLLDGPANLMGPVYLNEPAGNNYRNDGSRFELYDRWGNSLVPNRVVYMDSLHLGSGPGSDTGVDEPVREKPFLGYQRARTEQPVTLLQYLKAREWQLQVEPPLRGPATFMGN